ncbi:hypothetical protein BD769DRAFT_1393042 [Suillus cothurnatus]|nr:hypothetical protein BD769DRAFT_1393042 [Suillus cothurnatus]
MDVIKHSKDLGSLEKERDGYVAKDDNCYETEDHTHDETLDDGDDAKEHSEKPITYSANDSKVFCLQAHGIIDAEANDLQSSELIAHTMANTATNTQVDFAVKRGSTHVNKYGRRDQDRNLIVGMSEDANHLLGTFPCLFPYSMGGFEVAQPVQLSYAEHAKWSLRFADRRFWKDHNFIFQLFGVLQKRQVCASSCLQVSKKTFHDNAALFCAVHPSDLEKASHEEAKKLPILNPTILSLECHLSTVCAKVMVQVVLKELFGIKGHHHSSAIQCQEGIYGTVKGYVGTVEAQGQGMLHLHILLWLIGCPTAAHMKDLLHLDEFREKMEFLLAKNLQKHKCGLGCIKVMKGQVICKRCAPFPISKLSWIDAEGKWGPQWLHPWLNNWNPTTLLCTRSNNDVKLITNGGETKEYSWYITSYMAKKQHNTSNASALLAKAVAFHRRHEWYTSDIDLLNKCLIQRCTNTLSREQEFSAPEVISYLMGWGDRYVSHQTETIYFSIVSLLKCQYPALKNQKMTLENTFKECSNEGDAEEFVTLEVLQTGMGSNNQGSKESRQGFESF